MNKTTITTEYALLPYSISVPLILTLKSTPEMYNGAYDEIMMLADCKNKAINIIRNHDELNIILTISSTDPIEQQKIDDYKFINNDMLLTHLSAALYHQCIVYQCPPESLEYTLELNPFERV